MIGIAVQKESQKRQRAILRQIATRRIKMAALAAELAELQDKLTEVTDLVIGEWEDAGYDFDGEGFDDLDDLDVDFDGSELDSEEF